MSNDNIINLGEATNSGLVRSPEQALKEALNDIGKDGALVKGKKLIIIALDDDDTQYHYTWYQAGMRMSECVTLCEFAKAKFLKEMDCFDDE